MKQVNVGILGATQAPSRKGVHQGNDQDSGRARFPRRVPRPIERQKRGSKIMFHGQECTIVEASDEAFKGMDIVLGAAENDIAKQFAPAIVKAGAVFVDNSSAFRMDPNVPSSSRRSTPRT